MVTRPRSAKPAPYCPADSVNASPWQGLSTADPFLVVLDEPNSNLDAEGERALTQAILGVRARGGVVIVIAHRPSALAGVDLVLMMADGKAQSFGPKDEVLNKLLRPAGPPFKIVETAGAAS